MNKPSPQLTQTLFPNTCRCQVKIVLWLGGLRGPRYRTDLLLRECSGTADSACSQHVGHGISMLCHGLDHQAVFLAHQPSLGEISESWMMRPGWFALGKPAFSLPHSSPYLPEVCVPHPDLPMPRLNSTADPVAVGASSCTTGLCPSHSSCRDLTNYPPSLVLGSTNYRRFAWT